MPPRGAPEWMVPAFAVGIIVVTITGLIVPLLLDIEFTDDPVVRRTLPAALAIVGVSGPLSLRFLVLPGVFSGQTLGADGAPATFTQIASSVTTLAGAFCLSDAFYGAVLSILLDNSLWALPFGAVSVLSFATLVPWLNGRLEELRRKLRAEGRM